VADLHPPAGVIGGALVSVASPVSTGTKGVTAP
jgi:hypothetical protein